MKSYSILFGKIFSGIFLFVLLFIGCKKEESFSSLEGGQVTDVDGKIYKTIKIGDQWWMAEDLAVTHYRNGSVIQNLNAFDSLQWVATSSGAYCLYDLNPLSPGLLYNYFAVNDSSKLAPQGWHIPSDVEWKQMEMFIGMSSTEADKYAWRGNSEADKLKICGIEAWSMHEAVWANNETGFSARAGGCRLFNSSWSSPSGISYNGFWWSTTSFNGNEAMYRYLDYKSSKVFRSHVDQHYGFSVRCVKD